MMAQMLASPAVMVVLGLSVLAYLLEQLLELWPKCDARFIPILCIVAGPMVYPLFASRASVPPQFPNPLLVLLVNGLLAGLFAALQHKAIVLYLMKKFSSPNPNLNRK